MYVRCPSCKHFTRFGPEKLNEPGPCWACDHTYSFDDAWRLGSTPDHRHRHAMKYARPEEIDLASAQSVLLGIIPPIGGRGRPPERPGAPSPATESTRSSHDRSPCRND